MATNPKPSIFQIGKVRTTHSGTVVSNWGLGLCAADCACHRNPSTGKLAIAEDRVKGQLGLVSFAPEHCPCCEPWTADELEAIIDDLRAINELEAQEPAA